MNQPKHRFYAPIEHITPDHVVLPKEEARHATKVMRLSEGAEITVVDGTGGTYQIVLDIATPKQVVGRIVHREMNVGEAQTQIHVGMSLLKQASRWETFLEKAVELGCSRISPIVSERTIKAKFNRRRAESILIAALKQSGRSRLPQLDDPISFDDMLESPNDGETALICHEIRQDSSSLTGAIQDAGKSIHVLVGPEGGYSMNEVEKAVGMGWKPVWMGPRRLRAETAAIAALSVISQIKDAEASDEQSESSENANPE